MEKVGAFEATSSSPRLRRQVEAGEPHRATPRGGPVAEAPAAGRHPRLERDAIVDRFIGRKIAVSAEPAIAREHGVTWRRLQTRLHAAFSDEPFKDGVSHRAESILAEALRAPPDDSLLESLRIYCANPSTPSFAAETLRCLGRLEDPGTAEWRVTLVRDALRRPEIEIRDAALHAVEDWEDSAVVPLLKSHGESEAWLRDYLYEILRYSDA